jgi:hypothetical protein
VPVKTKRDEVDMEIRAMQAPVLRRDEIRTKNRTAEMPANRPMSLATLMVTNLPPKDYFEQKHEPEPVPVVEIAHTSSEHPTEASEDDPEIKNQMDMLQAQFSNFQKQYKVNESLLTKQKILGREPLANDGNIRMTSQPPESKSEIGIIKTAPVPIPPPFIIKADVKPVKKTMQKKFEKDLEPREELMIAIRNVGGRSALRKVSFDAAHTN